MNLGFIVILNIVQVGKGVFKMNKKYLKELLEENREKFVSSGLDIESVEELEDFIIEDLISRNFQFEFDIDIDTSRLLKESE